MTALAMAGSNCKLVREDVRDYNGKDSIEIKKVDGKSLKGLVTKTN
jgi:hypothetical protein